MYDAVRHASLSSRQHRQQRRSRPRYQPKESVSGILMQIQVTTKDCLLNCIASHSPVDLKKCSLERRDVSNTKQLKGSESRLRYSENELSQGNKEHSNELQIEHLEDSNRNNVSSENRSSTKRDESFLFPNSDECHFSLTSGCSIYQYSVANSADPRSEGHGGWKKTNDSWQSSKRIWKVSDFTSIPEIPSLLGNGKFGKVKLCRTVITRTLKQGSNNNRTDAQEKSVAVKILSKSSNQNKLLWRREVEIQTRLSHPNILHCYGYFQCSSRLYIVLDYCPDRDLATYSNQHTLSMQHCRNVISQVTSALHYLQQRNVAHRDVKLENILIDSSGVIKLADFGYAIHCPLSDLRMTFCGTLPCLPPELLRCTKTPYHALCVDAWSLGILAYELNKSKPLWVDCDRQSIKDQIRCFSDVRLRKHFQEMIPKGDADMTSWSNFVMSLLRRNPKSRMTIHQSMSHAWLLESDASETTKRKNRRENPYLEEKHGTIRPRNY